MTHARKQIRDAGKALITGLTTTGSQVHASRSYTLKTLPALRIYTNEEDIEPDNLSSPCDLMRVLNIVVEAVVAKNDTLDDELDKIIAEVEIVMGGSTLSGLVRELILTNIEIEMSAESNIETGVARMTWRAEYRTKENAPEVVT